MRPRNPKWNRHAIWDRALLGNLSAKLTALLHEEVVALMIAREDLSAMIDLENVNPYLMDLHTKLTWAT